MNNALLNRTEHDRTMHDAAGLRAAGLDRAFVGARLDAPEYRAVNGKKPNCVMSTANVHPCTGSTTQTWIPTTQESLFGTHRQRPKESTL